MRVIRLAVTAVLVLLLGLAVTASTALASGSCQRVSWGSLPKTTSDTTADAQVVDVRTGRHRCFDRLVIDLDGSAPGSLVDYVSELGHVGSGNPVPVTGGAILRIIVKAPAYDDAGQPTISATQVDGLSVAGYQTLRDVAWAGSFEGQTTLGLGVRARLPFRAFTLDGPGQGSRLVIDVAHSWNPAGTPQDPTPGLPGEAFDGPAQQGDRLAVMGVASDDALNVRALPGTDQRIVTTAGPTADDLVATGRARRLSQSIWYEVTTGETTGWASSRFLGFEGSTDDETAAYLAGRPHPAAVTMTDLGQLVAADFASDDPPWRIVLSVAPTVGDLGEVTYDVIGLGDDSVAGVRLHIFAEPHDSGDGFTLRTIEATRFCARGFDGAACV